MSFCWLRELTGTLWDPDERGDRVGSRLRTLFFILVARLLGSMPFLLGSGPPIVGDAITGKVDEQAKGSNQDAVLPHGFHSAPLSRFLLELLLWLI